LRQERGVEQIFILEIFNNFDPDLVWETEQHLEGHDEIGDGVANTSGSQKEKNDT
jgi:hypothetical protein